MLNLIDGVLHQPSDLRAYRIHQFTNLCCSYVGDRTCNLSIIRWTLYRILIIVQEKKYILFVFNTGGGSSYLNWSSGLDSDIPPSHGGSILSGRSHSIVNSAQGRLSTRMLLKTWKPLSCHVQNGDSSGKSDIYCK